MGSRGRSSGWLVAGGWWLVAGGELEGLFSQLSARLLARIAL